MKRKIQMLDGSIIYANLPKPCGDGPNHEITTGIKLVAVYYTPRSKKRIAQIYSCWEDRATMGCVGTIYQEIDEETTLRYCDLCQPSIPYEAMGIEAVDL